VIRVTVKGERRIFEAIDRLAEAISDQRKRGWRDNVDIRLDYQRRHMDTEGSGGWEPLSDEYRLRKVREVGAIPILQYSKRLYTSLTVKDAADSVLEEGAHSLRMGTSNPLGRYHHEGAGRLPKREVIVITDAEGKAHMEVIEEGYRSIAEGLGFRVS